jgi:hypothetical protein
MGASTIPAGGASGGLQPKYQKFTSSGTFTLPDGYGAAKPLLVTIQVIGGGGGGHSAADLARAASNTMGNWTCNDYFGNGTVGNITITALASTTNLTANTDYGSGGGGSGGLCQSQLYLTSNLTITVGAAGSRGDTTTNSSPNNYANPRLTNSGQNNNQTYNFGTIVAGGTGGTTTAGSLKASGGNASTTSNRQWYYYAANGGGTYAWTDGNYVGIGAGSGGTPSGTAGSATPLLGTLAGGSGTSTAVNGSFGIGGNKLDLATSTGVEGTGGGAHSIGASGAVIITWWQ